MGIVDALLSHNGNLQGASHEDPCRSDTRMAASCRQPWSFQRTQTPRVACRAVVRVSGDTPVVIATPGGAPQPLPLVSKGGKRYLFIVCCDSGRLVRIDLITNAIKRIASRLGHPVGLVIDATVREAGSLDPAAPHTKHVLPS